MKHTFRKCLSLVLALATLLSVCVVPLTAATPACDHYAHEETWSYIGYQDPTCTEYGGHAYLCGECNTRFIDHRTWKEPLNHKNADGTSALKEIDRKEATLEEDGWVKYVCNLCGKNVEQTLSATKCEECDYEYTSTATCTEAGIKTGVCKVCGHKTETAAPALGHDWDNGKVVVEPVCGTTDDPTTAEDETVEAIDAEILFTCDRCGETETKKEIAPSNHKWEWKEDNKAGCTVTPGYVCVHCNAKHATEPYSYTEHDYVDYNDPADKEHKNVAATCEDGLKWEKCSKCGDFKSTVLKADEYGYHTHPTDAATRPGVTSMLTKISVHTCGNPGFMKCSECGRDDIADKYDPAAHNYITVDPTCVDYGYKSCVICGHTVGYLYIDANGNEIINKAFDKLGHIVPETGVEEHEATCDQRGWRKYVCQRPGCTGYDHMNVGTPAERKDGYVYEYTTATALGHDWTPVSVVPAKCGVDGTTAHTLCERCGATQNKTTIPALKHEYITASIPANCLYPAHIGQVCKHCGIENMDPSVMSNWTGEKDETKHNWDESQTEMVTEATCVTPGLVRKYCTICNKPHFIEVEETGHALVKIGVVPATCKKGGEVNPGYEVFFCTVDGCHAFQKGAAVTTIPTSELDQYGSHAKYTGDITKDFTYDMTTGTFTLTPESHSWDTSTFVKFVGPDVNGTDLIQFCGKYSFEERICSECGVTYHKRLVDSTTGLLTGEHHPVSADRDATCTVAGYKGRTVCQRCNTVITPGEIIPAKHTFDTTAADYQGFKAADCFAGGWEEKGTCTVCQQSGVMNGATAPLDHKVEGEFSLKLVEKRAADCILFGYDAHYACTLCGAALLNAKVVEDADGNLDTTNVTIADFVTDLSVNGDNGYVAPLDHDWSGTVLFVPFACLEDGYAWKVCARQGCSEIQIQAYTFGYANHRYSDKTYSTDRDACEDSYNLCQNHVQKDAAGAVVKTYTTALVKCLNKDPLSIAAEPHKNAAGEIIDLSDCKNWIDDQDHKCVSCEVTFTIADVDHHGEDISETIEATCISYKYKLTSCTRCKHVWTKMLNAEYGDHTWNSTTDYVAPTWTTDGSKTEVCSLCGKKGTTVVIPAPDMFFDMSIDNIYDMKDEFGGNYTWNTDAAAYKKTAAMKVSKLANSSFVAVTIYATGSATNFTSINMSIPFDAEALQFAPGMTADKNETLVIDGKTFVVDYNGTGNSVELFIHVENAKDGAPQNAELTNRTALITLYFQVNPDFYDVAVKNTISEATSLQFGDISVLEYDAEKNTPKQLTAIVTDTQAPVAGYPEVNGGAYVITVYKLGDLNLNGTVTDFDAILVEEMAFANGYDAQADIDKDGDVDLVDFMYMKQYVIEAINYAELAAKVATDAE